MLRLMKMEWTERERKCRLSSSLMLSKQHFLLRTVGKTYQVKIQQVLKRQEQVQGLFRQQKHERVTEI